MASRPRTEGRNLLRQTDGIDQAPPALATTAVRRPAEILLSRHAADPPLRGAGRAALRHGPHRRLLPPLYRPGSRRRRHAGDGDDKDAIITSYRDHGHMLACGMDPQGVMAELTGRASGYSKGKGRLHAHVQPREELLRRPRHRRRPGADRHRPRLRPQVQRQQNVSRDLFRRRQRQPGPGLRGHEHGGAVEAAGVYIIENNRYGMGTSVERASAITELYRPWRGPSAFRESGSTAWTSWR